MFSRIVLLLVINTSFSVCMAEPRSVKDINPKGSGNPSALTVVESTLFFVAEDNSTGYELWKLELDNELCLPITGHKSKMVVICL